MATDLLTRALTHLEKENHEEALELLIDAWRETRAGDVAEAVDLIDKIIDAPPLSKDEIKEWASSVSQSDDARARGCHIRAISSMISESILKSMNTVLTWDDPRVGTLAIGMLTELKYSGVKSQPFWRPFFEMIPKMRDPRFAALNETLPQTWNVGPSMQRWLTRHLKDASTFTTTSSGDLVRQKVARILDVARGQIEARAKAKAVGAGEHAGGISGESLLADIYDNPSDDAARLVYADWLLERGDPRGEFIAIQLRASKDKDKAEKADKAALKRERELLKAHKKDWIGRLVPVIGGDIVFRRGFLAEATVKFRHQRDVEQYGSLPEWATLEVLEWGDHLVRDDQVEWSRWIGSPMRHLRIARGSIAKFILAANHPWAFEELRVFFRSVRDEVMFRDILESPNLPHLKILETYGYATPAWLNDVKRCPPELRVGARLDSNEPRLWCEAAQDTSLEALVLTDWSKTHYRFTRDATTRAFTRLSVEIPLHISIKSLTPNRAELQNVMGVVGRMTLDWLTSFDARIELLGESVEPTELVTLGRSKMRK